MTPLPIAHPGAVAVDLLRYAVLCFVSMAVGLGVLRLCRVRLAPAAAMMLAPIMALACWSVAVGWGVALGIPLRLITPPLWALSLAVAVYGLATHRAAMRPVELLPLAPAAALPVFVTAPFFIFGLRDYPGSALPDGWSYVAHGQYLWTYANGTEGGLAPLYQYAAHLSQGRHIAASLLAVLSPVFAPGDTQSVSLLFLAWTLFVFAASCAFFASTAGLTGLTFVTYLTFAVAAGWTANLVGANNFDNALAFSFAPALAGAVWQPEWRGYGWIPLFGLLIAALRFIYPELTLAVLLLPVAVLVVDWLSGRRPPPAMMAGVAAASLVGAVLASPNLPETVSFVRAQATAGLGAAGRPGDGMFPGLLRLGHQPSAFWGLGAEWTAHRFLPLANAVAGALIVCSWAGVARLIRMRMGGVVAWMLVLLAGAVALIIAARYSYGAYKLILLTWWVLAFTAVTGADQLCSIVARGTAAVRLRRLACAALILAAVVQTTAREVHAVRLAGRVSMSAYREMQAIEPIVGDQPVLVAVDDPVASAWAAYFARDYTTTMAWHRSYMAQAHLRPFMARTRAFEPDTVRYLLTDAGADRSSRWTSGWTPVWRGRQYQLLTPTTGQWSNPRRHLGRQRTADGHRRRASGRGRRPHRRRRLQQQWRHARGDCHDRSESRRPGARPPEAHIRQRRRGRKGGVIRCRDRVLTVSDARPAALDAHRRGYRLTTARIGRRHWGRRRDPVSSAPPGAAVTRC